MTTTFNPEMNDHSVLTPDQLAAVSGGSPAIFCPAGAFAVLNKVMSETPTQGQVWNAFVDASGVPGVPHM